MRDEQKYYLTCEHCGCESIESATGIFYEDDGGTCMTCGFPGAVSVSDDYEDDAIATWMESDDPTARCTRGDCVECR